MQAIESGGDYNKEERTQVLSQGSSNNSAPTTYCSGNVGGVLSSLLLGQEKPNSELHVKYPDF